MKITYSMDFNCTPERVWYWLGTPERAVMWQTNITKTEIVQETPGWVGTTFRETIEENGRGTEMEGVVTDYRENKALAMYLRGKYNTVDIQWLIEDRKKYTRLTQNSDIRFRSFLSILSIILRPVFRRNIMRQLEEELLKLKELCEGDEN
jgi:hypothetical protein